MNINSKIQLTFIKNRKYFKCNLETLKIIKFIYDYGIKMKITCSLGRNNTLEIRKGTSEYIFTYHSPVIKHNGIRFYLTFAEMKELMEIYHDVMEGINIWTATYMDEGYDTVD